MNFFLEKLRGSFSSSQNLPTLGILHTKFGLIWTTSWPDKKDLFLKFLFRESQKVPHEILTFFLGKLPENLFVLHSNYPGDTLCRVWFDLDNTLTRWKRPIFKIPFSRNSKSSVWNTNFFPRQAIPKILFVLHSNYTGDTPCRVWFDLNTSLTR